MAVTFPPLSPILKPIQHYMKTAAEHEQRDPVVAYWSRLYALQAGLKIDRKSKESLNFLTALMDWLEKRKKDLASNEAISNEVVAQAHIENYAFKLFMYADTEDRASRFNKNVVKAFYTAGMLFDILSTFGELSDEVTHHRKYAKWKAAYIHNCLKNGEDPLPGPMGGDDEGFGDERTGWGEGTDAAAFGQQHNMDTEWKDDPKSDWTEGAVGGVAPAPIGFNFEDSGAASSNNTKPSAGNLHVPSAGAHAPPSTPSEQPTTPTDTSNQQPQRFEFSQKIQPVSGGVQLTAEDFTRAQKYCKWAGSALQYEDVGTAVDNLQKALRLLSTGRDS